MKKLRIISGVMSLIMGLVLLNYAFYEFNKLESFEGVIRLKRDTSTNPPIHLFIIDFEGLDKPMGVYPDEAEFYSYEQGDQIKMDLTNEQRARKVSFLLIVIPVGFLFIGFILLIAFPIPELDNHIVKYIPPPLPPNKDLV